MRRAPGMFAQLALVIALVLAGAGVLAAVLGRELAIAPAADQLARAMRGFAGLAEEVDRNSGHAATLRYLQQAGLDVRERAPAADARAFAPFLRVLRQRTARALGPERAVVLSRDVEGDRLWMQLRTSPALWISFGAKPARGSRRFTLALLLGCVGLTWLAAAYCAQRLVGPLRQLAQAAPGLVRGEAPRLDVRGPREVRELADALEQASEDVRSAADERALMLAGISHDLRTPLTRVQFATALLPDTDPTLRAGIDRDIAEIDAILSQFIAYARDGRDEAAEPLDLARICREALDAAGGPWDVQCPDTAPLRGRPIALRRALENLVANAQRHGAAPFALRLVGTGDGAWQVTVCDHGPGMDAAQAQRALQPFVHDPAGGGSGLGLAIVDRVARQHGGALQLLPNPPRGLRAVLRLRGA
ncbi:ATP-binding protein [Pseudoxanthomonas winnipegensis]|uniref:ATP-binding protein n=1 Tax=Pseudoxanthomonas winnipegensis TaxID=2480810 RepID=UPI0025755046|nr:ATP-binding protein [Pseudoxanthomonas winnipegensis]WJI15653.1 ATP-binding protein [Pseudoxanthomonas winnipegensis]